MSQPELSFEPGTTQEERVAVIAALAAVYAQASEQEPPAPRVGRWAEPPAARRWPPRGRGGWTARR